MERQSPEAFLEKIHGEQENADRGQLKIFFGYAAGVGKTYAMLQAAHDAKRHGIDVVCGYIEPHGRPETEALIQGLEVIPYRHVQQGGADMVEFDLDAALARKPALVLVDELAHTNARDCRHAKRYQDVAELLKAGIDVYTTVNVQHIESLNDTVASITGVLVRERIPDSVFDSADQVMLVDIEPQDLINRLKAGEVYKPAQAEQALGHFFSVENLTALREIALRRCADRVNRRTRESFIKTHNDYYTDEHILVCLSSSPSNAKLIRTAARMAAAFRGKFTALFVETRDFSAMSEEDKKRLEVNTRLAQQLGAQIETVYGDDVPVQIAEFAKLSAVSKVVIGRSAAAPQRFLRRPSLSERLIAGAPDLDVYIIPDNNQIQRRYRPRRAGNAAPGFSGGDLAKSIGMLAAATVVGEALWQWGFMDFNIITVYVLAVVITAMITEQRIYSLVSSLLSVFVYNFFFTEPRYTFHATDDGYPIIFVIMFAVAFLTSTLTVRMKDFSRQTAKSAYRTRVLFDTNQALQQADNRDEIVSATAHQLIKLLDKDVVFYLATDDGIGAARVFTATGAGRNLELTTQNERAVALWVRKNNKHAGATTDTLMNAACLYLAVRIGDQVYGVVGIHLDGDAPDAFQNSIMLSILGECALAMENDKNLREKEAAAILAKNEQLRANLLRAISHDLRTPLTSISGNAGNLLANGNIFDEATKKQMYSDIYEDSMWLINLVENLLAVTRIEEGRMQLRLSDDLMEDVIDEALKHVSRQKRTHPITVDNREEYLLARMDARLMVQVIINIVDNAIKYTPAGTPITITTRREGDWAVVAIADAGPGIAADVKPHIFDMFYTGANKVADSRRSLGLGLSLCKSIVTAHQGSITVGDNVPQGTVFTIKIPIGKVNIHE
ncbi:MAG: sensor histidine kinase KdpD [Peptococcaceae bacterium]|nr:sensor histidine kinase KdpD [Peptococcaceae bacterium]